MSAWLTRVMNLTFVVALGLVMSGGPATAQSTEPSYSRESEFTTTGLLVARGNTVSFEQVPSAATSSAASCDLPPPTLTNPVGGVLIHTLAPRFESAKRIQTCI